MRPVTAASAGSRPSTDSPVSVLPEPDSPTMASTSLSCSESDTPLTASTGPWAVWKLIRRSSIRSSGVPLIAAPEG